MNQIFVIGRNRSGTKWLSNLISNHSDIACIKDERFGGILETNMFENMHRCFGKLSIAENLIAFYVLFSETSFFKISGMNKDDLYLIRPENYYDFFNQFMKHYADSQKKSSWLQKSSVKYVDLLMNNFSKAKFIVIQRDVVDNVQSTAMLRVKNNNSSAIKIKDIISDVAGYVYDKKKNHLLIKKKNILFINFNDLKQNPRQTLQKICNYIDIQFEEKMLIDTFLPNTSFFRQNKNDVFTKYDIFLIKLFYFVINIYPLCLLNFAKKYLKGVFRRTIVGSLEPSFIKDTFHLLMEEKQWISKGINNNKTAILETKDIPQRK
jgi:Sulfotransferase family